MKKVFYVVAIAAVVIANGMIMTTSAQSGEKEVIGDLTCYHSWSNTEGDQSFIDCLHCTRIDNKSGKHDSGTCTN